MVGRTGCTTRPVEKRRSADAIVSMRSSIVSTDSNVGFREQAERYGH